VDNARMLTKAQACLDGYLRQFTTEPPRSVIIYALCVAEHETRCGDAWPGEHNWGACTARPLKLSEIAKYMQAGLKPGEPKDEPKAKKLLDQPGLALHRDSAPKQGWYYTYFASFKYDVDGAEYLVKMLYKQRPRCLASAIADCGVQDLAKEMYNSRYYTGVHQDAASNIADYGKSLSTLQPQIEAALVGWFDDKAPNHELGPTDPTSDGSESSA